MLKPYGHSMQQVVDQYIEWSEKDITASVLYERKDPDTGEPIERRYKIGKGEVTIKILYRLGGKELRYKGGIPLQQAKYLF
jgi:hypothetical protein